MLKEPICLPDGTVAESYQDIDKYLKRSGNALAGDYSPEYLKNIRLRESQRQHAQLRADIIHLFKKGIWYE